MVSRTAVTSSPPRLTNPWIKQIETLPGGIAGVTAIAIVGLALATAVAALPWAPGILVAVGLPAALLTLASPRVGIFLFVASIPLLTWTSVAVGKVSISSTDVVVALILLGFLLRGIATREISLHGGPTIAMLGVVFGCALLSSFGAIDFPDALKELVKLAEMIGIAIFASSVLAERRDLRFAMLVLIATASIEAMNGIRQFITRDGPDFFSLGPFMRAYGDFGQPNALAGYLGMILPFGISLSLRSGTERKAVIVATMIIGVAIATTWSRGAWLGIAVGLSVMALTWSEKSRRGLAAGGAVVALLVILGVGGLLPATLIERFAVLFENFVVFDVNVVDPTQANWALVERMAHWQAGWHMALDFPWFGVGPGNYEAAYPGYFLRDWVEPLGHAHNYYINTFAETGIVGLLAFLTFTITVFVRLLTSIRKCADTNSIERIVLIGALGAAVTFTVHNSFDNMFVHGIGIQFGLILGLVEGTARLADGDQSRAGAP